MPWGMDSQLLSCLQSDLVGKSKLYILQIHSLSHS